MGCEAWREVLSAQLDGEATPHEQIMLRAHLAGCPGCQQWLAWAVEITRRVRMSGTGVSSRPNRHRPRPTRRGRRVGNRGLSTRKDLRRP
ncbi:zf-HC2 domain-containing protein [Micromonospora andamanensis]|uniref:zf-HC2 domain-containing protein n=1 Tax=Micromonospora andamanensis TaxID=1287068 RepID=UPI00194DC44A